MKSPIEPGTLVKYRHYNPKDKWETKSGIILFEVTKPSWYYRRFMVLLHDGTKELVWGDHLIF